MDLLKSRKGECSAHALLFTTFARAAGIPVIAVDFGYSEHPVSELGPDRTISSFVQLPMSIAAVSYGL